MNPDLHTHFFFRIFKNLLVKLICSKVKFIVSQGLPVFIYIYISVSDSYILIIIIKSKTILVFMYIVKLI